MEFESLTMFGYEFLMTTFPKTMSLLFIKYSMLCINNFMYSL